MVGTPPWQHPQYPCTMRLSHAGTRPSAQHMPRGSYFFLYVHALINVKE